ANPALEESEISSPAEESDFSAEAVDNTEASESFEFDEYLQSYIDDDPSAYQQNTGDNTESYRPEAIQQPSFHEFLDQQLQSLNLSNERQTTIALQIIGSLTDDGYLGRKPSAICDDLLLYHDLDVSPTEVLKLLTRIQTFDPPGIAAQDLQECLLLQLDRKIAEGDYQNDAQLADFILGRRIIAEHFELFSKKHYQKLLAQLEADEDEIRDALHEILRLNPKPASGFAPRNLGLAQDPGNAQIVIPDFVLLNNNREDGNSFELQLNQRRSPALRISHQYEKMLADYSSTPTNSTAPQSALRRETSQFIRDKIDAAQWFIDAIEQRRHTLLGVMSVILEYQRDFFLTGDQKRLRPMILKDIAEPLSLDISTISRVVNSKYVQTEYGTYLLKFFFSEGMLNDEGEEVSTKEIKNVLSEIIEAENKRKPLSDEQLQQSLSKQGYSIARRTVAKYREQLGLPVARLRKEM
ncbi:MAG: RNA polymerase factor sigma-54, partial [Lewinella sp.]|nr:RNA polymerase factor sigma-54 [Lewinella sp.]